MDVKLKEYQEKRNFGNTLEPKGTEVNDEESLKFVVQHHMARRDHYDFRLEWAGVLLSWAVPKGPSYDTREKRLAVQVEDHPLDYRNFEGTIPKGEYGGGIVMLWDEGFWEPYGNVEEGLRKGELKFTLQGRRMKGKWALIRLKGKPGDTKDNWLLLKEKDEYAKPIDGTSEYITSIRTGRTMEEIEQGDMKKFTVNPFDKVDVQLAKLVNQVPQGDDWIYEMKYDGYRIVAFVESNQVRLVTRNGNDYQKRFYDIASSLINWAGGRSMVLDGEMVITDASGKTDFQALQNYLKNGKSEKLTYIVFDLLALEGKDLRNHTIMKRKEILETLIKDAPPNLYYSRYIRGMGQESFAAACKAGMEGIVGKRVDSIYSGSRNGDWIKLKCEKRQEFVIGGYTLTDKKSRGVSALLLGVYEDESFIYAGRAGTGMSEKDMTVLEEEFSHIKRLESPFQTPPKSRTQEEITWLEPLLVAEIKFAEWTKENLLRQASFQGIRTDKSPKEVKREKSEKEISSGFSVNEGEGNMEGKNSIIIGGVKISNPDKVLYDELMILKADVVRYYEKVLPRMLPYVSHRILTTLRCPKGVSQTCFYKKHPTSESKGIVTFPITNGKGETEEYFYVENGYGILSEVQMGTLEFHTWGSSIGTLEKPDMMVFDLDPDEDMEISRVRQGVLDVKNILNELSLDAYLKTSGGKGYHVVVPLKPSVSWDTFHDFAKGVAVVMEQKWPDRYTSNVRKANRKGKIFIDWIRNGRGATSVAPYSLRGRKGAKVSMPILWEELDTIAPDGIDMKEALLRIAGEDPWKDYFKNQQMLK
ncbi:DNA ligase D [Anaerotignum propionicum]|uniref:DNA ligase D n=1 Tax=Anaerotignum propionicum TaxID=28446 RepID=UPI002897164C|nr:DNA ligase D [Anaerotignum propionicum]